MKQYTSEDIQVVKGTDAIRKRPDMYAGKKPWGPNLAGSLMQDLVALNALPAKIEKIDEWWLISSEKDWLITSAGTVSHAVFSKMIPIPEAGRYAFHTEVVIAALADALVTFGTEGITWINGGSKKWSLPAEIRKEQNNKGKGRFTAFIFADDDQSHAEKYPKKTIKEKIESGDYDLDALANDILLNPQECDGVFEWCREAANLGDYRYQNTLAAMYFNGNGVESNWEEAYFWARLASKAQETGDDFFCKHIGPRLLPEQRTALEIRIAKWKPTKD
jgi:hypothetical protein